MRLLQLKYK